MALTTITLDAASFDPTKLAPVRFGGQGESEAAVRGFCASEADFALYSLDAPGKLAMLNAIAKVAGIAKDASCDQSER